MIAEIQKGVGTDRGGATASDITLVAGEPTTLDGKTAYRQPFTMTVEYHSDCFRRTDGTTVSGTPLHGFEPKKKGARETFVITAVLTKDGDNWDIVRRRFTSITAVP